MVIDPGGTLTYTPNPGFNGTDSYSYTVSAGGVTETATVSVTVAQVDDAASFGGDTAGSGGEDAGAITGTLSASDAQDGMTNPGFTVTAGPTHGSASIDPVTGAWSYTPDADYNGADSFTVAVTDDDGNVATRAITLSVTPVADIAGDSATTDEDSPVTSDVLANDSFEDPGAAVTAVT